MITITIQIQSQGANQSIGKLSNQSGMIIQPDYKAALKDDLWDIINSTKTIYSFRKVKYYPTLFKNGYITSII